jgi:thiol-disulfide isomerase/thioredoxin
MYEMNNILVGLLIVAIAAIVASSMMPRHYIKGYKVVRFVLHGCHYCQELEPTWRKLCRKYSNIEFITIDATKNPTLVVDVKGYPTIRAYGKGKTIEYNGPRTLDDLSSFVDNTRNALVDKE